MRAYKKHGHASNGVISPTYRSWYSMVQRCTNPNDTSYRYYGGRGIKVHKPWVKSFVQFLSDVGKRPRGKTLDRIDNMGHYEPGNVRWATTEEQRANKREPRLLRKFPFEGGMITVKEAAEIKGMKLATINNRLHLGWSFSDVMKYGLRERSHRPKKYNKQP